MSFTLLWKLRQYLVLLLSHNLLQSILSKRCQTAGQAKCEGKATHKLLNAFGSPHTQPDESQRHVKVDIESLMPIIYLRVCYFVL